MTDNFARALMTADLTIEGQRTTQLLTGDIVQIINENETQAFVQTVSGDDGWVHLSALHKEKRQNPESPKRVLISAKNFWSIYSGTPHANGGLTSTGIDCSGLTKMYFLCVYGRTLPHSSRRQRALGEERSFNDARNENLVFGDERETGLHHVGLFTTDGIWHTDRIQGVVLHSVSDFVLRINPGCSVTL